MSELPEEKKITDPAVTPEPEMRLTLREWVLYWKVKYEQMLARFQDVVELINKQKQMMKDQMLTIAKLNDRKAELEKQIAALQADIQAAIKTEGAPPAPASLEEKRAAGKKTFRKNPKTDA